MPRERRIITPREFSTGRDALTCALRALYEDRAYSMERDWGYASVKQIGEWWGLSASGAYPILAGERARRKHEDRALPEDD